MSSETLLEQVLSSVDANTKKYGNFLSAQADVAERLRQTTKRLYDLAKVETARKNEALPELVVEGFDEEQIWQQLELQNEAELTHFLTRVSRILVNEGRLDLPTRRERDEVLAEGDATEEKVARISDEEEEEDEESEDEAMSVDGEVDAREKTYRKRTKTKRPSVVDDKFFKLEQLDEYLTREEKKESPSRKEPEAYDDDDDDDDDDAESNESVNLFEDASDDEESENGKMMKYADFFDSPESAEEDERVDEIGKSKMDDHECRENVAADVTREKRVKFNLTNDSEESDASESPKDAEDKEEQEEEKKSSMENRQERLQRRIEELERQALSEKPWQLKGEVAATERPQNSLLEEYVEFDITARPAPVITEQTTIKLEDLIKQRIKDKAWDDVERKFKPVATAQEYKKKLAMDQEKSKKSLAQIYEDAYVSQRETTRDPENAEREPEEPKEHTKIRQMMQSIFAKLDALCNYHYTPKMAQPEVKIVSNLPAISMEEVAPIASTDATLLAPEEIKARPRGELIGRSERTETDMKRERRKKKIKQRVHQKAKDKMETSLAEKMKAGVGRRATKSEAASAIKKLTKARNIVRVDETSNKAPKSSAAFFAQLQDQVNTHVNAKTKGAFKKKKRNEKNAHTAVKLKL